MPTPKRCSGRGSIWRERSSSCRKTPASKETLTQHTCLYNLEVSMSSPTVPSRTLTACDLTETSRFPLTGECDSRLQIEGGDLDSTRAHRQAVAAYREVGSRQEGRQGSRRQGQSSVRRCRALDLADGGAVARFAGRVRQVERRVHPLHGLGAQRPVGESSQDSSRRSPTSNT